MKGRLLGAVGMAGHLVALRLALQGWPCNPTEPPCPLCVSGGPRVGQAPATVSFISHPFVSLEDI